MRPAHCFAGVATAVTLVALLVTSAALALVTPPEPRVFASATGRTGLKVLPKGNGAVGVCFTLKEDGSEHVLWRRDLVNVPGDVVILDERGENERLVITLDTYGKLGGAHALVVYDAQGKLIIDAASASFVPDHANPPADAPVTSLGRPWRKAGWSVRQPHDAAGRVEVNLGDGRIATIDPATKQVSPAQHPSEKSPATQSAKP
jgi:hypothetical protein